MWHHLPNRCVQRALVSFGGGGAFDHPRFQQRSQKHAAGPRGCPCQPRASQKFGAKVRAEGLRLGSSWVSAGVKDIFDHSGPARVLLRGGAPIRVNLR